jgi:cell wall-associated NlpC family hydrolase
LKASRASSPARNDVAPKASASPRSPERFSLTGPSIRLDRRIHAVRGDVADVALADRVFAPHYARPLEHGARATITAVRAAPSHQAVAVSEVLRGECFAVIDASGDWAWGFTQHDGYVGYVPLEVLGPTCSASHVVATPAALLFASADIKSPVIERLPMGARIAVTDEDGGFLAVAGGGFVHRRHIVALDATATDAVEVAARLTGVPYRWGGRSGDGIDCSGLVQLALGFAGIAAPRDSDQQQALGNPIDEGAPLRRGDLVFLPGHVGIMASATDLLHANAHWMRVVTEPLADVLARQAEGHGLTAIRRLP